MVFWVAMPCELVGRYQDFGETVYNAVQHQHRHKHSFSVSQNNKLMYSSDQTFVVQVTMNMSGVGAQGDPCTATIL
jgi:hypothetical protein